MSNVTQFKRPDVKASLVETNFYTRRPCHVCGGATEKVGVLCEVTAGDEKGFRVCERCIEARDFEEKLAARAAVLERDAAELRDLIGRLIVPTASEYYQQVVEHDVRVMTEGHGMSIAEVVRRFLLDLSNNDFTHEPSRRATIEWLMQHSEHGTEDQIEQAVKQVRAEAKQRDDASLDIPF